MTIVANLRVTIGRCRAWLAVLAVACAFVTAALAAPLERDLGQGLRYFRLKQIPSDLPGQSEPGPAMPWVVDVRYLPADAEAAATFDAWLKFRATPRAPIFLVANGETSPALLRLLAQRETGAGIVLVGARSRQFEPDIAVSVSSEQEQRAYAALTDGVPVTALLTDNPDKVRNDEASLSRDRLAEASADATSSDPGANRPRPPLDVALQRAVHLHRALLALRKI